MRKNMLGKLKKMGMGEFISLCLLPFQGITVPLGTVSFGAVGFMSIRNKSGRTLVNRSFCSANTWS